MDSTGPALLAEVAALRARLWGAGFRPVPIHNAILGDKASGKRPWGDKWQIDAERDPPRAVTDPPRPEALGTGIYCAGFRGIDLDIDNPTLAHACLDHAAAVLGTTAMRTRAGSARCLLFYRAAEGAPRKLTLAGRLGKIEALGAGQQFVAFGTHYEHLATLQWEPHPPGVEMADDLPAVTEAAVAEFLRRCAPIIDARFENRTNGADPHPPASWDPADGLELGGGLTKPGQLLATVTRGTGGWHDAMIALVGRWVRMGLTTPEILAYAPTLTREGFTVGQTVGELRAAMAGAVAKGWGTPDLEPPVHGPGTAAATRPAILSLDDLAELADPVWLIDGLVPEQSLVVPFGPPKAGKSFIMLSIGLHIAAGMPWFGRAIRYGAVVYVVGEGVGGLKHRVKAMLEAYGMLSLIPFWIVPRAVNFRNQGEVQALAALIRQTIAQSSYPTITLNLLVIDTLARAMPGADENSAQDVGVVVAAADWLREELTTAVALIHHEGKDEGRGARGTSALRGAWDTGLRITGEGTGTTRTAHLEVTDQRDAEAGQILTFEMREVMTGVGRASLVPWLAETTTVASTDHAVTQAALAAQPTGKPAVALTALKVLLASDESAILPPFKGVPTNVRGAHIDRWRQAFYARQPGTEAAARKKAFARVVDVLTERRIVGVCDPWVWLIEP